MRKLCVNANFPPSFGLIAPNSAETVSVSAKLLQLEIRLYFGILSSGGVFRTMSSTYNGRFLRNSFEKL